MNIKKAKSKMVFSYHSIHTAAYDFCRVLIKWIRSIHAKNIASAAGVAFAAGERYVFGRAVDSRTLEMNWGKTEIFQERRIFCPKAR